MVGRLFACRSLCVRRRSELPQLSELRAGTAPSAVSAAVLPGLEVKLQPWSLLPAPTRSKKLVGTECVRMTTAQDASLVTTGQNTQGFRRLHSPSPLVLAHRLIAKTSARMKHPQAKSPKNTAVHNESRYRPQPTPHFTTSAPPAPPTRPQTSPQPSPPRPPPTWSPPPATPAAQPPPHPCTPPPTPPPVSPH